MSIHIVARLVARPDSIEALRPLLLGMLEPTRQEAGCIRYELINNKADAAEFLFVEEWASQEAINAHMETPHLKGLVVNSAPLLAEPLDVRFYTPC
ncbi:putative quinol monooxygenase [Zoogloea dura]|jgi:quinol monooxygenase YgiN|uniref:Antibiotic biosynthesis monooxygenase n=1 Tax=Zoogloea dura TaxID=2728840 RepID=A0A848G4M7_9RHOO|nr:putative quinol monooxygenase [Zoogloea dura]NML26214.1 antibiotic biosynthesis monooxygenase [Zoogloea dura]